MYANAYCVHPDLRLMEEIDTFVMGSQTLAYVRSAP